MKKIFRHSTSIFILSLIVIEVILFFTNYTRGTYLIGWDNTMPEFNITLNLKRAFFSIWQDYRGLGLLDGMAHTANLIHTLYIALLSIFLPQSIVRYLYIHATHLAGGIGFFFLARKLTKNQAASFLGALFYMFNLGIIQMYFAPLEAFATHFAALPFLALTTTNALHQPTKKNMLLFFLASLLCSPQSYVPTVFIAYSVLFASFLITHLIIHKKIKNVLLIALVFLCANAFWLLPYIATLKSTAKTVQSSRINEFSSEEDFYLNKAKGGIQDVLMLKGFMIDAKEYDQSSNAYVYFMHVWKDWQNRIFYNFLFIAIIGITVAGIGYGARKKSLPYLLAGGVAFFFLANNTILFEQLNNGLRTFFPLVGEAFRFPFTKFITLFVFCYSVFFVFGLAGLLRYLKRYSILGVIGLTVAIVILGLPAFKGNFTSPMLRLPLPKEYLQTFAYLNTQDENKRIALLPAQTYWNWQYTSWGFRGSGFLWYGLKQSILLRAFDPWSLENEQFYNELSFAVNSGDCSSLTSISEKYNLSYFLLDQSIINTLSAQPINYNRLQSFLGSCKEINKEKVFGKITLYAISKTQSFVSLLSPSVAKVSSQFYSGSQDSMQSDLKNYRTDTNPDIAYPFPSLNTLKLQDDAAFTAYADKTSITLVPKQQLPASSEKRTLVIPSLFQSEFLVPVHVQRSGNLLMLLPDSPRIYINDKFIQVQEEPIIIPLHIQNPTRVTFADTKQLVPLDDPDTRAYLLNHVANTLVVSSDTETETFTIDTKNVASATVYVTIPDTVIHSFRIVVDKVKGPLSIENVIEKKAFQIKETDSALHPVQEKETFAKETSDTSEVLQAKNGAKELTFYNEHLFHKASYILFANIDYKEGLPVNFYIDNSSEYRPEVDTRLSKQNSDNVIIIPKTEEYFQGYGFHFIVKSVGNETAEASIHSVSLYPFPMATLEHIQLVSTNGLQITPAQENPQVFRKINSATYIYKNGKQEEATLVLSQSYQDGWKVYATSSNSLLARYFPFFFGKEIKSHVRVDNWANGWVLSQNDDGKYIVAVFLPQYLAYLGYCILFGAFFILLLKIDL